jgi:DNA-directed RNA polymerase subunit RPC12/RpoP
MAIWHAKVKNKAYVCNLCRKPISYSTDEAGTTLPCPHCRTTVTLPGSAPHEKPARKRPAGLFAGLLFMLLLGSGGY